MSSTRSAEDRAVHDDGSGTAGSGHRGWSEETRRRILEAGVAELRERGLRPGVGHIRLAEVTERADVSLAIAYRIWSGSRTRDGLGGQDRFHRDLVAEAFRTTLTDYPGLLGDSGRRMVDGDASFEDLIRVTAEGLYRSLSDDRAGVGILLGLYGATLDDPELSAVAAETHRRSVDDFTGLLARILDLYGREMADGLSVRDLVVSITAVAAGFLVRDGVDPGFAARPLAGDGREPGGRDWTLFGYCTWALFDRFTRPAEGGTPAEITPGARPRSAAPPLRCTGP